MNAVASNDFSERLPTKLEIDHADHLRKLIAGSLTHDEGATLQVVTEKGAPATPVTLTPSIAQTFLTVLRMIASGQSFQLIPLDAKLSTQQAADLLNVSRPFL